jgi:hypothetical protein
LERGADQHRSGRRRAEDQEGGGEGDHARDGAAL